MASYPSPFPSPLFSEANPPWPTPPPPEHSMDHVLLFFSFSLVLLIVYFCCFPFWESASLRNIRLNQLRDIEAGLRTSIRVTQRTAVRVVAEEGLKTYQYTGEEPAAKNSDCCVCMEEFTAGDFCKMLGGCGHSFHDPCITPWLTINPHCPICRVPVLCGWRTEISDSDEPSPTPDSPRQPPV